MVLCTGLGSLRISPVEVIRSLLGIGDDSSHMIIFSLRLPRVVIAVMVGAALAVSGALLQGIVRNPLTSPDVIGITGGAQLGTIKSVAGDSITLTTPKGDAVLPANGFGPGPKGVTLGLTAEQLSAAMGAAAPSTPGTTPEASTTPPGATSTTTPSTDK